MSLRTSITPCTTGTIASPMKVTRLPDTCPPFVRRPGVEDFSTAANVLSKIKSDEQWVRQRPPHRVHVEVDATLHNSGHRCDPDSRTSL